ncbi:MAG: hypothetical protein EXR75_13145 [Myxococcales bacterium]|nr:hypothetical protein [Myxococcales bacterium]
MLRAMLRNSRRTTLLRSLAWLSLVAVAVSCATGARLDDATGTSLSATTGGSSCLTGLLCGEECVDTATDRDHCGACDAACGASEFCVAGKCTLVCEKDFTECDGACVALGSDASNCGACGTACEPGFVCDGKGSCALSCQAELSDCSGKCVELSTNNQNCGVCGLACEPGFVCNGMGSCALSCQSGLVACDGKCIDPTTDEQHCGASSNCLGPNAGSACVAGEFCIGAGVCDAPCPAGQLFCGAQCVEPMSSNLFCGASGNCQGMNAGKLCVPGEACLGGICQTGPSSCKAANGLLWCFHPTECGHACTSTCAAVGKTLYADKVGWFQAQDTVAECQAISVAFGMGTAVAMNGFTYACLEDSGGAHTGNGGLLGPILCSTESACPQDHAFNADQLGLPCGANSRRSICPCQ